MYIQAAGVTTALLAGVGVSLVAILRAAERSVGLAPPTAAMLAAEVHSNLPLFRHFPHIKDQLAWRELGDFPTPVHRASIRNGGVQFQVKREDLASPIYGGNKVRTLQHQLAVCESRLAAAAPGSAEHARLRRIAVVGSGGSNQVVASLAHAGTHLPKLEALWVAPDEPDLDNTLNMLSTLSLPNLGSYATSMGAAASLVARLRSGVVVTLGGNAPSGVLGHASAAIELAEQIEKGDADAIDDIYLAVGSSCTISGLVVGIALSRHLGLSAYDSPTFALHGVIIHHLFAGLERRLPMHRRFTVMPLTIGHTVRAACAALASVGGPDVTDVALEIVRDTVKLRTDADLVGVYGAHSEISRAASREYDATGAVSDRGGTPAQPLWLCGHFVAKAFAAMLADLEASPERRAMLWQTKSAVQPRGSEDEWAKMQTMPSAVHAWADEGKAESSLRPGSVRLAGGSPDDYRGLMTQVEVGAGVD